MPQPERALGGLDVLRDRDIAVAGASTIEPLPLAARARERHRTLSDLGQLAPWVLAHPERLRALIRPPFSVHDTSYPDSWTMQMPPFMAQSNRWPLTLTHWQYDLLMAWADDLVAAGDVARGRGRCARATWPRHPMIAAPRRRRPPCRRRPPSGAARCSPCWTRRRSR